MSNMFRNTHLVGEYSHFLPSMISTNNGDKSFDIVTTELATKCMDKQTMKCLSRVLKCTAIFFSLEKDPFSFNFRVLPFMPLTISADTYRIVYR